MNSITLLKFINYCNNIRLLRGISCKYKICLMHNLPLEENPNNWPLEQIYENLPYQPNATEDQPNNFP